MLKFSYFVGVIKGFRNFPDLTFTVTKTKAVDSEFKFSADSDYAFWYPGNSTPYRHEGHGKSIEDALNGALNTFLIEPTDQLSNDKVFITKAHAPYQDAEFIDGTGKKCTYEEARKIIKNSFNIEEVKI